MKKFFIFIFVLFCCAAGAVYVLRHEIFQFSAEALIEKYLPKYLTLDQIDVDIEKGLLTLTGLGIKNPPGYDNRFLATVDSVRCHFKMRTKDIRDGLEVTKIVAYSPKINVERLRGGRLNVNEMDKVLSSASEPPKKEAALSKSSGEPGEKKKFLKLSDFLKLTDTINLQDGKVTFVDKEITKRPYMLEFDDINGSVMLGLNDSFTEVLSLRSQGKGMLNNDFSQNIRWIVSLDPTAKDLTMSNRYEVSGINLTLFKPYYDNFSPVNIDSGRFSGTLVFDFDHGNIGSMNTLKLQGLSFRKKTGGSKISGWQQDMLPELIGYLESSPGEIMFDFSIKGTMKNPKFYPGPHVKKALQSVVVNKITDAFRGFGEEEGAAAQTSGAGTGAAGAGTGTTEDQSDVEMAVNLIRGLLE